MAQQLFRLVATVDDLAQPRPSATRRRQTTSPPSPPRSAPSPATRATHRLLMLRGFTSSEAANLTAYICGIRAGERPWKLEQINQLLFLRHLHQHDGVADRAR